jgi:hypothetical protein
VQITFQLTPEDYYYGLLVWRTRKAWQRWLLRFAYASVGLTVPVAVFVLFVHPDSQSLKISGALLAFAALWFTFMLAGPKFSAHRQFRGSPTAQSPITMETSDAGVAIHSAYGDSKVSWSAYVAWAEAKSVFVILPQPRIYVPIPKRAFTPEQMNEFREILRRNIRPMKR